MMQDDIFTLFEFNRWADARVVQAIQQLTPEQYSQAPAPGCPSVRATLVHMADAMRIWALRIHGEEVTARITEAEVPTFQEAVAFLEEAQENIRLLLPTLSPERLAAPFSYRNLQGQTHSLPLWAVLRHMVNHGSYHRGQVASQLMGFGVEPPLIDLALWASREA